MSFHIWKQAHNDPDLMTTAVLPSLNEHDLLLITRDTERLLDQAVRRREPSKHLRADLVACHVEIGRRAIH